MPRKPDGTLDGQQCLIGALGLYDYIGKLRTQLLGLIAAEKARTAPR